MVKRVMGLHRLRPASGLVISMALLFSVLVVAQGEARADWSPPAFERSMAGIGRPGVYAWGLAYNPVSDEIIVSDYLNFKVRRYSTDGRHLGDLDDQPGEPWSVATDPNSGDIYYMNNWDNRLERFDSAGNHISTISVSGGWNAWIDVDHRGWIWVIRGGPQATNFRLDHYHPDGTKLGQWNINAPAPLEPTMFGIEVAGDGSVFLSDANNGLIHVYGDDGNYERSFGEGHLSGGDARGLTLDEANGWVYVSDASSNTFVKFTMAGDYLGNYGGTGEAPGLFNGPRQLAVDDDGDVWVADFGNYRFQEFASDGTHLGTYPDPPQSPPAGHLAHAADSVVDPATGDVWIADTYNQRFHRLAADGTPTGVWGKRGGTDGYGMNYPSTIGFDPVLRRVWVGMEEGRHLKVYDDQANYLFIIGDQTKTPENPGYLRNVTDIDFYQDKAFISDEQAHNIKVLDADTGDELYEIDAYDGSGWSGNHGLAINPANGDLFVASYSLDRVSVFDQSGALQYSFGSSGTGDGQFRSPRDVAIIDDVVYVSDAETSRVQAFQLDGTFLGRWGGWGKGPHQFRNPMGLDTDPAGRLYVTDVENGRITVFNPAVPKPAFVWGRPEVTLSTPGNGQLFTGDQLFVTGTATDNDGIANVGIRVQNAATGLWWNGRTSSWQTAAVPNMGLWTAPSAPATSVAFSWYFPAIERGASYNVEVVARDIHNTASNPAAAATVTIADDGLVDLEDPTLTMASPVPDQVFGSLDSITIQGSAADDLAVDFVDIAIQDKTTSLWWTPGGDWGAFAWLDADLATPGTPATDWSYGWLPPAEGDYAVSSRVGDAAGKEATLPQTLFTVVDAAADTVPPDGTVSQPARNEAVPLGTVSVQGMATDNIGVATVEVAVRNNETLQWLRPNGTWGNFAWHPAAVASPGDTETAWSWSFEATDATTYGLVARAIDLAGNIDPTRPWIPFSVTTGVGDTVPPNATVTTPTRNQTLPAGLFEAIGSATDDVGVAGVSLAVRDNATLLWLRPNGTWGNFAWLPAELTNPDASTTDWTFAVTLPDPGDYAISVRAADTSANMDPTRPWVPFILE